MNKKQATFALVFSVFAAGSSFGAVAHAATQTQSQGVHSQQTQEIDTLGGSHVTQNESSQLSSTQVQTTNKQNAKQSVDNTTSSLAYAQQDHTTQGNMNQGSTNQSDTKQGDNTTNGSGAFTQSQDQNANYSLAKTNTDKSSQTQVDTSVSSEQTGTIQTTDATKFSQSETGFIHNTESQTAAEQSITTVNTMGNQTNSIASQSTYNSSSQPSSAANVVVGYGVFDMNEKLISDAYGVYTNPVNNYTQQYDAFIQNEPTLVIIRAVNALGNPVVSSTPTTLYLRTNNANGSFMRLGNMLPIQSVELPAGSKGVTVIYVNHGGNVNYDVLDATTDSPYVRYVPVRPQSLVVATNQTQTSVVSDATAKQTQTVVASTDQQHSASTATMQTEDSKQSADSKEQQSVSTADGSKVGQQQESALNTSQDSTNQASHNQALDVSAKQEETVTSTDSVQISQEQAVTVQSPIINVTLDQSTSVLPTEVDLTQSILVNMQQTSNLQGSTLVNATVNGVAKQWTLNTSGPVTFDESQSVDTSDGSKVQHSITMDYLTGTAKYSIPIT